MAEHTEMGESPDIPSELMKHWLSGDEKKSEKPVPRPHEKPNQKAPPEPPAAPPDDDSDPFGGYYPEDDDDDNDPPESPMDEKIDEILNNTTLLIERFRSLGNIAVTIEGQGKAIAQALGITKGKGDKGDAPEPADNKVLKEILAKIDNLEKNGLSAQLSEEFDNLKPENIKVMLDAFDKKLKDNYKIAKSYSENLSAAMRKATMAGLVWGLCAGLGGSVVCSVIVAFLLR